MIERSIDPRTDRALRYATLAGFLLSALAMYPGMMMWDSAEQILQASGGDIADPRSPAMMLIGRWLDRIIPGPLLMLTLQMALLWAGGYLVVRTAASGGTALRIAVLWAGLLLPLVLGMMGFVPKDAMLVAMALMAFGGIALGRESSHTNHAFRAGVIMAAVSALLVLESAMRPNATGAIWGAAAFACYAIPRRTPRVRWSLTAGAAAALLIAATGMAVNSVLSTSLAGHEFTLSWGQHSFRKVLAAPAYDTLLSWPGICLALGIAAMVWGWRWIGRGNALPFFLAFSGVAQEATLLVAAPSTQYRCSHWLVASAWIACLVLGSCAIVRPVLATPSGQLAMRLRAAYRAVPMPDALRRRITTRAVAKLPGLAHAVHTRRLGDLFDRTRQRPTPTPAPPADLRPHALIIEHRIPTPDRTSGSTRLQAIIDRVVQRGWAVTMASSAPRDDYHWILSDIESELPIYERTLAAAGVETIYGPKAIADHLRDFGHRYRLVVLSYPEVMHQYAPLVRALAPTAFLVYDTVDLHGVRFRREAISKGSDPALLRRAHQYDAMESANIDSADMSVAITPVEEQEMRRRSPHALIEIVPNIHSGRDAWPGFEGRDGMVFIGHYLHPPNDDAMRHFAADIMPLIGKRIGPKPLYMLGSSMTDPIRALAGRDVHAIGWVDDPLPWFDRCRVFVAPLRFGAGMKGKIGQAMSLGIPVVTTSVGAEGMGIEPGVHALVADDPDAFADAVARLHTDAMLWDSIATAARDLIERRFSPRAAGEAIDRILTHAQETHRV